MPRQEMSKIKGVGDIVFCLDATGSMQPCIDKVKSNIETFVSTLETSTPNAVIDWRARALAYRDFNVDSNYLENTNPFVDSAGALKTQLDAIIVDGGGDEPESTLDAIMYAAKKSDWRPDSHKIIVVFTDATPIHDLNDKTVSELGVKNGMDIFKQELTEDHIKLFLYGQKSPIYDDLQSVRNSTVVQYDDAVKELASEDFKSIMNSIGKTVSGQITGGTVK